MMEKKPDIKPDMELASFFEAAKEADAVPNAAFLEAVAADALAQTNARAKSALRIEPATPWLTRVFRNIGGWQTVGAMTACACIGIYAGYSSPDNLNYLSGTQSVAETEDDSSFTIASDIEALFLEV